MGVTAALAIAASVATAPQARAAEPSGSAWPARPITIVVPVPAGGAIDGVVRLVAKDLGDSLGQSVLVENRAGGGSNIAAVAVSKAPPDGYRLLAFAGAHAVSKLLYKNIGYDSQADLAPIVLIGNIPQVVVASARLPVTTLAGLVDYAREHPGLTVGNSGTGTSAHIAAAMFAQQTGLVFNHIAYRGNAPLVTDLLGAQIDFAMPGFFPQAKDGKVLAVTSDRRLAALPDVPTVGETGLADVRVGLWFGLAAPAGTPPEVIDRVNAIVNAYLGSRALTDMSQILGMQPLGGTPERMRAFIADEIARLGPVLKAANITGE